MDNNYWKEKYADYHSRSESRIAELEEEKEEFRTAYNAILEQCKKEQTENERLKSCLQEIKTIAKDNIIGCFSDKCDFADEILQKITKAEEE